MLKPFLTIVISLLSLLAEAQAIKRPITAMVGWSHAGQLEDYLMGFDIGILDDRKKFHYFVSFDFRPYRRKVQEFIGNNTFFQYQEERYMLLLGTRYFLELQGSGKGVFLGGSIGYNYGKYRGLTRGPDEGWILRPNVGLFWNITPNLLTAQLGYQNFNSRSDAIKNHWLFLSLAFKFSPGEI